MQRLRTELCARFDLDHPIVQAPIGSASTPELAAAVANAGALGTLAMSWRDAEEIHGALAAARNATEGTLAANVVLDDSTGVLTPEECLEACLEAGVAVISLSFGDPSPYVDRVHDTGASVMVTVGSVEAAADAEAAGADAIVVQGWEAGGHVQSEVSTMALVPAVVDAVDVPVVAAGGIADGRGLAATLALGGDGVWLGTRFVATPESGASVRYRGAVADASEVDTVYTDLFDGGWPGQPHRVLENETVERWRDAGEPSPGDRPGEGEVVGRTADGEVVRRYDDVPPVEGVQGDVDAMAMYAGQSAGGTDAITPAASVVTAIVEEAVTSIEESGSRIVE